MAEGGGGLLDVGTLTGTIEMDDRLSGTFELIIHKAEHFASKLTGTFGAITVGVGAVATAVTGVAATITLLAVKGSEIADVEHGFNRLAGGVENADRILEEMRKGVAGTVSDLDLMTDANRLLQAGVKGNAEDFGALTAAARTLSREGFGPMGGLMSQIDRAMMTGNAARLARIGITVDTKKAENDYAGSLGLSVQELSRAQHQEAVRIAIVAASNKLVAEAGMQELSFAEKVKNTKVALANWSEELEKRIATSPAVSRAFDVIGDAIKRAFGGDSATIQDKIVDWVNRFANATAHWGPIIIEKLGEIKDWIVAIYNEVQKAWDAVPDWFKNIALNAGLAGVAMYALGGSVKSVTTDWQGSIGITSNIVQIMGKSLPDAIKAIPVALVASTAAIKLWAANVVEFGFMTTAVALLRQGVAAMGFGFVSAGPAMTGFMAAAAPVLVWVAAIGTAVTIATLKWKLHNEEAERTRQDQRQAVVDTSNLARINTALGTSYTTIKEASDAWFSKAKENEDKIRSLNHVQTEAEKTAEEHAKKVDALVSSMQAAAHHVNLTKEAFNQLTYAEKMATENQAKLLAYYEEQIADGEKLTTEDKERLSLMNARHIALIADGEAMLKAHNVTLEYINGQKALGLTEKEIAAALGVTVEQMNHYVTTVQRGVDITTQATASSLDYITKLHHNNINDWIRAEEGKTETTLRMLRLQGKITQEQLDFELQKLKQTIALELQSREEQVAGTRAYYTKLYEIQKANLDLLEKAGSGASAAQVQRQREATREAEQAMNHWAAAAEEDFKKGEKAADKVGKSVEGIGNEAEKASKKIRTLSGELIDAAEAARRRAQGGAFDVTKENFDESLRNMITAGGRNPTGQGSNIDMVEAYRLASQGYGFQEILDIFNKRKTGTGGSTPPPRGPAIPGFEKAETATKPVATTRSTLPASSVETTAGAGAGGVGVRGDTFNITQHINGTGDQVAKQFTEYVITQQKLRQQMPTR